MTALKLRVLALAVLLAGCGGSVSGTVADEGEAVTGGKCPAGSTVQGIDVSEFQGSISWSKVAAAGKKFAIARVSDGSYLDPDFARNWSGMKSAGLLRGAYQFFEPGEDPTAQAKLVIARVGKLGTDDLPVMLDVEVTGGKSAATIAAHIQTWVNAIKAGTGKEPFIYTGAYFWDDNVKSTAFKALALNVAWYGTNCPGTPNAWSKWTFHQYSSTGAVSGISGHVDLDVYNGSLTALKAWVAGSTNDAPRGYLDSVSCAGVKGWSQDLNSAGAATKVVLSNAAYSSTNTQTWDTSADLHRDDLCTALGSCNHGFDAALPRSLMDGGPHSIHAYGADLSTGKLTELKDSPRVVTCAVTLTGTTKRHVPSPSAMTSFGFTSFLDKTNLADSRVNAFTTGAEWPATRKVIKTKDADAVYLVDGSSKRHIQNQTSLHAWHLDSSDIQIISDAAMDGYPTGPALPLLPELIKGTGDAIYVVE